MDVRWEEAQRAFQARVLTDDRARLQARPYRTFVGEPAPRSRLRMGRAERLMLLLVTGGVLVTAMLSLGLAREWAAFTASFTGGVALMVALSPAPPPPRSTGWSPLLAVYPRRSTRDTAPVCVTEISLDELERLGVEGTASVVGSPRPGATFGLFVDDHLVWPRTPPRAPEPDDPRYGDD